MGMPYFVTDVKLDLFIIICTNLSSRILTLLSEVQCLGERSKEIYGLLLEAEGRKKRKDREDLLHNIGVVEEYFEEGQIKIARAGESRYAVPLGALLRKSLQF